MSDDVSFVVSTRRADYTVTRRIVCRDLDTAYSVAAQLRKRTLRHGYRTFPVSTTAIHLAELHGSRVVACSTWNGAATVREAIENARSAIWRSIPADNPARGACVPMPHRRPVRIG